MKIRNGFVSNSSSSSFIIHGTEVSLEESSKLFNDDDYWSFQNENNIKIEQDRYYFGGDLEGYIFGISAGSLGDGQVSKIMNLTEEDKQNIVDKLKTIGIERTLDDIFIYAQYISNDNY